MRRQAFSPFANRDYVLLVYAKAARKLAELKKMESKLDYSKHD